jgi:hypothetical protein
MELSSHVAVGPADTHFLAAAMDPPHDHDGDDQYLEVDAALIFSKRNTKLRTVDGSILLFNVDVYECEAPYVMIFIVKTGHDHAMAKMDVRKEDLARELRLWLEGKLVRNPAMVVSSRIESLMQGFVNFGKTPKQEDLISWVLSRSELFWGNRHATMAFGGLPKSEFDEFGSAMNRFQKTVDAHSELRSSQRPVVTGRSFNATALKETINSILQSDAEHHPHGREHGLQESRAGLRTATATVAGPMSGHPSAGATQRRARPASAQSYHTKKPASELVDKSNAADVATFALMSKLLGSKKAAMEQLKKTMVNVEPPRHRPTPYDEEIERRKNLRAAQLSACKLLRSGGKKYPEEKKALPPTAQATRYGGARPPPYGGRDKRRFVDGQEVFEDDGHDSVTAPPPFDPTDDVSLRETGPGVALGAGAGAGERAAYRGTGRPRSAVVADTKQSTRRTAPAAKAPARITSYGAFEEDFTTADAAWATEILMRQARLENRLGKTYY